MIFSPDDVHGEIRRRYGELDEAPHLLDFFFFDVISGVEVLHFAGDLTVESGRIESRDPANAAGTVSNRLPDLFGSNPHGTQKADTRYDDSS